MGEPAIDLEYALPAEPPQVRERRPYPPCQRCALCALKGIDRGVVLLPSGAPTGLCSWHAAFENEVRSELRSMGKSKTLTREDREIVYRSVTDRMVTT